MLHKHPRQKYQHSSGEQLPIPLSPEVGVELPPEKIFPGLHL